MDRIAGARQHEWGAPMTAPKINAAKGAPFNVDAAVAEIRGHLQAGEKAALSHNEKAGKRFIDIAENHPEHMAEVCKKLGLSDSRRKELMQIAGGRKTADEPNSADHQHPSSEQRSGIQHRSVPPALQQLQTEATIWPFLNAQGPNCPFRTLFSYALTLRPCTMALLLFGAKAIRSPPLSGDGQYWRNGTLLSQRAISFWRMNVGTIRNKIIFDPAPMRFGEAWAVRAVYPSSRIVEHITGFASEAAAKEWIASDDAKAWLRSRGYPDD
jgi:hypothetical protein